jgi:hypothetical protein
MPGTIVAAILQKVREDYDNFPIISIAYDGTQHSSTDIRLEAFMHQAQQYMQRGARSDLKGKGTKKCLATSFT